jgi:23S rRNA (uridine2552-2'-O)-methyltransferase
VAVRKGGERGRVVGLDLLPVDPVAGATILQGDFQDPVAEAAVEQALGGQADLVLSDMAPNTTGHAATDHLRIMALAELALDFALRVLAPGGGFVAKVFAGGSEKAFLDTLKRNFAQVRHAKPPASRKDSAELYVVATGFKGAQP